MGGLEKFLDMYDTYESLLAKVVEELRDLNSGRRDVALYLNRTAEAAFQGLKPAKENGYMPEDIVQCFNFVFAIATIKGYLPDTELFEIFRCAYENELDKENKRAIILGAEELKKKSHFHSYIALLKAADMWDTSSSSYKEQMEDYYFGSNTKGCVKDFKYRDHTLIEKVLGPGKSTQAS